MLIPDNVTGISIKDGAFIIYIGERSIEVGVSKEFEKQIIASAMSLNILDFGEINKMISPDKKKNPLTSEDLDML